MLELLDKVCDIGKMYLSELAS